MSMWTHITACLSVETGIQDKRILGMVREYIRKAPKITGSELDAAVFLNLQKGFNSWTNRDCDHCRYGWDKPWVKRNPDECERPDNYECQEGQYQTCVVISIQGDLRDRNKSQTQKEFNEFIKYIKKRYSIRDYAVNIEGDY